MSNANTLEAMLAQYESNSKPQTRNNNVKEYDLKNYFTTFLPEKQDSATKRIRILPTTDGSSPFVEIHGHKAQIDGDWKTFVCLKHEKGEDCPFCEAHDALRATGKETDKELAKKYNARRMYVVKVIDRDKPEEGIKFWRFNHDYRKQGILDKIFGVLKAVNKDITHPETGRDLLVIIGRDQNKRPVVQSIQHVDPSPLSEDAAQAKEWLADTRTWEDVYSVKPYEYLEIIVKGGTPVWDKDAKKFIDKVSVTEKEGDNLEEEVSLGVPNVKPNVVAATTATVPTSDSDEAADDSDDDDDLPF
jgi:hypothetical protein